MYSTKQSQEIGKHQQPFPRNKSVVFCVQCAVSWDFLGNARIGSYNRIFVTFSLLYALSVKLRSILVKCQHNHRFGLLNEILCLQRSINQVASYKLYGIFIHELISSCIKCNNNSKQAVHVMHRWFLSNRIR